MPEIKNTFLKGKMNKDLDERLVPNGEYRHALNVEIATSEGSDIGSVKNILGNHEIPSNIIDGFTCVGSVANEKTNKLYWFISSYSVDAIVEYDLGNEASQYIIVDRYASTKKAVLKFFGNIITGINIIDNLLFWTDNRGEPKKINIDVCKAGTVDITTHTQLNFDTGSFHGITVELTANDSYTPFYANEGRYVWFEESQILKLFYPFGPNTGFVNPFVFDANKYADFDAYLIRHYRGGKFLGTKRVKIWNGKTNSNNGSHLRIGESYSDSTNKDFKVGDVIFGNNIGIDIEESHITVIKLKPLNSLSVKVNHSEQSSSTSKIPNLFETTFPRFSYRYKFRDGEYSAFAPFTQPVFNPKYPKDTSKSIDASVSFTKDNIYDIKEPYNKAMANSIHSVDLSDFITAKTPEDVEQVEILYKKEDSSVIYSIATIKHLDKNWHYASDHEGIGLDIGIGKAITNTDDGQYQAVGGQTKGRYSVTTENIYAALPANQLLRPWDSVPRKALAQEVTGNRIVYGNYLQGYEIPFSPLVSLSYADRKNPSSSFEFKGLPSIKSQRNYQLGVVLCDKYGRETPVFTSQEAAASVSWQDSKGSNNASKSNQLVASIDYELPLWVDSLKFFVKQTSNEYYNLVMDRAWVTKNTYELDDSEGHLWISFPSSDRNKVSEEDYIILKKKIEPNSEQISFENKFKIIDISNEAPDAIKYRLVNYGTAANAGTQGGACDDIFDQTTDGHSPSSFDTTTGKGTNILRVDWSEWQDQLLNIPLKNGTGGDVNNDDPIDIDDLYVSWSRVGADGASSSKYKVIGGFIGGSNYVLNLAKHISKKDADIAHCFGDASQTTTTSNSANQLDPANGLHPDLVFQIERKELIDSEDFSGKFFVKISKNQISSVIETGAEVTNIDKYQVAAKAGVFYFQDNIAGGGNNFVYGNANSLAYGITNYNGDSYIQASGQNNHQREGSGYTNTSPYSATVGTNYMYLSDTKEMWAKVQKEIDISDGSRFFIDATHVASGQSDASDYAKYNCVTWSGATKNNEGTMEDSSWSYPPLKTWITEFEKENGELANNSAWAELVSENVNSAGVLPGGIAGNFLLMQHAGMKADGWVGPPQSVNRHTPTTNGKIKNNHINGLEGIVTTVDDHTVGPRRWFSGMNGADSGVGEDTKTYANDTEEGRHFMHLSFLAPGKNLHNNGWYSNSGTLHPGNLGGNDQRIYGPRSFAANLQGIWGGGVFTGDKTTDTFGTGTNGWKHLPMEGNHDSTYQYQEEAPGPGVGQGYDMRYREAHERQWDPTFLHDGTTDAFVGDTGNKIRDFIRNLYPGSKFRFNRTETKISTSLPKIGTDVYTIKKVVVKKLYNHTSWRKPKNLFISGEGYEPSTTVDITYQSVEEVALDFLASLDDNGGTGGSSALRSKIVNFGGKHNRRVCFIIELDKNPDDTSFNPLSFNAEYMNGDIVQNNYTDIEFLQPVQDIVLSDLSKFPAIWELSPKKQQVDLDIYYEASNNIPVKINNETNEFFAPIGCKVEMLNAAYNNATSTVYLESWDDNKAIFYPGFAAHDTNNEINYENVSFKFIRQDGSYTIAEAGGQQLIGSAAAAAAVLKTDFTFKQNIGAKIQAGLSWYNCFSFGNGLESNRIKDDFNEVFITNGVKASTTTQEQYKEERRKSGLIYSGIYNSNSGVNDLNQFIMAEKITKDLNPTYGSIQKLFQRRISLIAFCEDRVIQITSNKDAIYNADGNPQLISTNNVLGDANPFVGEFGISKNPESFASESYRAYFADKQRGSIIRLSKDGLTPISSNGMEDYFKDNLPLHTSLLGTYDAHKNNYNITLGDLPSENIVFNSELSLGSIAESEDNIVSSLVANGWVYNAVAGSGTYTISTNNLDVASPSFYWGNQPSSISSTVTVTNHPAIPEEYFQDQNDGFTPPAEQYAPDTLVNTFNSPVYETYASLPDSGWWYNPGANTGFMSVSGNLFGYDTSSSSGHYSDAQVYSTIRRIISGTYVNEGPNITYDGSTEFTGNASVSHGSFYFGSTSQSTLSARISQCITREDTSGSSTHNLNKSIMFDRVNNPQNSYIEFQQIGLDSGTGLPTGGGVNDNYLINGGYTSGGGTYDGTIEQLHGAFFNGDELHVQFDVLAWPTYDGNTGGGNVMSSERKKGYNIIIPKIELWDGGTIVPDDKLQNSASTTILSGYNPSNPFGSGSNPQGAYAYQLSSPAGIGGDFQVANAYNKQDKYVGTHVFNGTSEYKNVKSGLQGSATVLFPRTSGTYANSPFDTGTVSTNNHPLMNGNPLYHYHPTSYTNKPVRLRLGCSFKFMDPDQQSSDGTNLDNPSGIGNGTMQKQVVNELRIRIGNNEPKSTNASYNYYQNAAGNTEILSSQLWSLETLFCKKGLSIKTEGEDFDTTYYIDPADGSSLTLSQLQAQYPGGNLVFDPIVNQYYVNGILVATPQTTACVAVPDSDIPAWTEIHHPAKANNWASGTSANSGGATNTSYEVTTSTEGWFGPNNPASSHTATLIYPKQGTNVNVAWKQPEWFTNGVSEPVGATQYAFDPSTDIQLPSSGTGSNNSFASLIDSGTPNVTSTETYDDVENRYFTIDQDFSGANSYNLNHNTSTPWVVANASGVGPWYLVDIEYSTDEFYVGNFNGGVHPKVGSYFSGGVFDDGLVSVVGVVDQSLTSSGTVDINGIGLRSGPNNNNHVTLIPTWRTEYSTDRWVLRAIFQVHHNSDIGQNSQFLDHITLRFYKFKNEPLKIQKIITRDVSLFENTGLASDWNKPSIYDKYHTFSDGIQLSDPSGNDHIGKSNMYYSGNKLCWDNVPKLSAAGFQTVSNYISDLTSTPSNTNPWTFKFTVSDNAFLAPGNFSGVLGARATTSDYDGIGTAAGIKIEGITATGDYVVEFDLDASSTPIWIQNPGNANAQAYTPGSTFNKVWFYNASSSTQLTCAVGQVELTDLSTVFFGAEIGSWNYGGFEPTIDQHIVYDMDDQRIQFKNAPLFDTTFAGVNPVMINQLIETPLNRYETYEVQFSYSIENPEGGIGAGELYMYYYNSSGYGFAISNIGATPKYSNNGVFTDITDGLTSTQNANGQTQYLIKQKVKITADSSIEENDINTLALINTLVIRKQNDANEKVIAWIDDVSIQRVMLPDGEDVTVSFSEKTNGWTSFKSFVPESGVSLSNKYFTFKDAKIYEHYVPKKDGNKSYMLEDVSYNYTPEEANNYNNFYGQHYPSTIKAVLNAEPSIIKTFNTLAYEGSQAYAVQPANTMINGVLHGAINIDNAKAVNGDIHGWHAVDIETDLETGMLREFIKKEGKWFGPIKGNPLSKNNVLDTSNFSVQGLGKTILITLDQ